MGYEHFDAAVYCTVGDLSNLAMEDLARKFDFLEKHIKISKVYLETYRSHETIDRDKMAVIKEFFIARGIAASGGITATADKPGSGWGLATSGATFGLEGKGFESFCYTDGEHRAFLRSIVEMTAGLFDEFILDDFFFTDCKCPSCIEAKGERTWAEFRLELMKEAAEELVLKPAKAVNPGVNVIIKYPNWYEYHQETGYNLQAGPSQFPMIYTGTETRDAVHTQQHLPRYLSYFIMRYLENAAPGRNGGGWFDCFDCSLQDYAEQACLTVFSKAGEVTLFALGALTADGCAGYVPVAGYVFDRLDRWIGETGNPVGAACYKPYHSTGEEYLHDYIGMLGIPLEPAPEYPEESASIFLTESAAADPSIVDKIKESLQKGATVTITSGLLRALQGKGIESIANIQYTDRKAAVDRFAYETHWCGFRHYCRGDRAVIVPQLNYATNDAWQIAVALGEDNNFPILLQARYGTGTLFVLTVPEDFGDLYHYPREVLHLLRRAIAGDLCVLLDAPAKVGLFTYDNDTFVAESFLPHRQDVKIIVNRPHARLKELASGEISEGEPDGNSTAFTLSMAAETYLAYKIL